MQMIEMTSWLIEKMHGTLMPVEVQPCKMKGQLA
ncbi:hypothetical protein L614_001100000220 [Ochrobactrum sp. J50]|nr:hypothetical protein L614_001100000220 [Ochrobactrum sp. J50]